MEYRDFQDTLEQVVDQGFLDTLAHLEQVDFLDTRGQAFQDTLVQQELQDFLDTQEQVVDQDFQDTLEYLAQQAVGIPQVSIIQISQQVFLL